MAHVVEMTATHAPTRCLGEEGGACGGEGCGTTERRTCMFDQLESSMELKRGVLREISPNWRPEMGFESVGCCCLPPSWAGWAHLSKRSGTSTAPVANCSQLGRTKPSSSTDCTLHATPMKLGDACCSSTARKVETSGWRSLIILIESTQLARCAPDLRVSEATWQLLRLTLELHPQGQASHVSERTGVRTPGQQIEHRGWP